MNFLQKMEQWGNMHHPKWMDLIRIALGIFLIYKGIEFLQNMGAMLNLMTIKMSFGSFVLVLLGHYIVAAHVIGGILMVFGLLTRFACLIQIPILIGAIVFINASPDVLRPFSELILSIVVLLLLVYFLIIGNGPWSFSWFIDHENERKPSI
jgi:uncharacterized membrane protein YphA (DoxX/SURF4 family)